MDFNQLRTDDQLGTTLREEALVLEHMGSC